MVITSSIDKTCKLWDLRNPSKSLKTFIGLSDEIMDVCFNLAGTKIASGSSDNTAKIYDVKILNMNLLVLDIINKFQELCLIREVLIY